MTTSTVQFTEERVKVAGQALHAEGGWDTRPRAPRR